MSGERRTPTASRLIGWRREIFSRITATRSGVADVRSPTPYIGGGAGTRLQRQRQPSRSVDVAPRAIRGRRRCWARRPRRSSAPSSSRPALVVCRRPGTQPGHFPACQFVQNFSPYGLVHRGVIDVRRVIFSRRSQSWWTGYAVPLHAAVGGRRGTGVDCAPAAAWRNCRKTRRTPGPEHSRPAHKLLSASAALDAIRSSLVTAPDERAPSPCQQGPRAARSTCSGVGYCTPIGRRVRARGRRDGTMLSAHCTCLCTPSVLFQAAVRCRPQLMSSASAAGNASALVARGTQRLSAPLAPSARS